VSWFRILRLRAAAKRYARRLPAYLSRAYANSEVYTPQQIAHAVAALRLPSDHMALAYAAYLPKAAYDEIRAGLKLPMAYEDARAEFYRHAPDPAPSDSWNPSTMIRG
jgi:hypothetical protein